MKLSIITINYNNIKGLRHTIDSVVAQTYKDFEWIIIDGGSTDGSKELIEQNAENITYWVSEPDKGIYNAMNKGIRASTGDYLLFLNSGDCLADNDVVAKVMNAKFTANFVYGVLLINDNGCIVRRDIPIENISGELFLRDTLPHPATFIHRKVFEKYGYYDEEYRVCSDWAFFMKAIFFGGESIKKIPVEVAVFNLEGISSINADLVKKERNEIIGAMWSQYMLADYKELEHLRFEFNNEFIVLARRVFHTGRLFRFIMRRLMKVLIKVDNLMLCLR